MTNTLRADAPVTAAELGDWLAAELPRLAEKHGVPAAQAGVLIGDEVATTATGILHLGTGVTADTDSLFQIGSITKVWTASLVMQLVDEELVDLDLPIRTYLPEFKIADESAAAVITTRHLLTHRAGFEGDLFTDTGRGDDCIEKYVETLATTPQLFTPGTQFSYNNAGYVVLGRLIEVMRGTSWDDALTQHLIQPLGLTHAAPGPYEAILHRVAQGHIPMGEDGALVPAPFWALVRSNSPAGSTLSMRVADLLGFAKLHLDKGVAADGTRVLSEASVTAMQQKHVDVPYIGGILGEGWGLGWELDETPAGQMVSHDGSTVGQNAYLKVLPDAGVAVALLTNGGDTHALSREVFAALLERITGQDVLSHLADPADAKPRLDEETAARFTGTYSASVMDLIVTRDEEGELWVKTQLKGEFVNLAPDEPAEHVAPYGDSGLIQVEGKGGIHIVYAFLDPDADGRFTFLHTSRALPRSA